MIGETIGNFKIVSRLGRGGMGEVWLAEQQSIGTKVAIKLLSAAISEDTEHVQRFFNEARAVSRIQHAGIVKIFDVGHHGGHAYLIMEYLEGETLAQRIAKTKRLPLADLCEIGRQVASVLDATHSAGITHRDLKPDNIFVVPDRELSRGYRVKILDFGIAKLTGTLAGVSPRTTGTMGTPAYMAPEQWGDASKVDWRADLYSLGCVTFEMACGRPPFIVSNIAEACAKHLHDPPPHVRDLVADAPAALDTLVDRLLSKSPTARAGSMRDVERTFAGIGTGQPAALAETVAATGTGGHASSITPPSGNRSRTGQGRASASVMETLPDVARPRRAGMPWPAKAVLAVVVLLVAAGIVKKLTGRRVAVWDARQHEAREDRRRISAAEQAQPVVDAGLPMLDAAQVASAPLDAAAAPVGTPRSPKPPQKPGEKPADKPVKEGTIDADAVFRATFNDRGIQLCYLNAVKKDPTIGGKLTASVWIDEAGHGSKVTATGVSAAVEQCVAHRLEAIRYPKPVGGPVLAYIPFSFEPPSAEDLAKGGTLEAHAVDTPAGELRISPTAAEIRAELERIQPKLEECGHATQGRMQIEIGADGKVVQAHVLSAVAQLTVGKCVEEAVKTNAKFPVSKSGTKMTVSFHLPK